MLGSCISCMLVHAGAAAVASSSCGWMTRKGIEGRKYLLGPLVAPLNESVGPAQGSTTYGDQDHMHDMHACSTMQPPFRPNSFHCRPVSEAAALTARLLNIMN